MKKYILIIILIISCLILSGCGKTVKESYLGYEQEHELIYGHYAVIKKYSETGGNSYLTYDIETKVMYQILELAARPGISEYYINKNNKLEIGIYGYNYKGEQ